MLWGGRELGVLAVLLAAGGCSRSSVFQCTQDTECSVGGRAGFCDTPGYCSFDDAACPSGRRFGSLAGMGLADECVPGAGGSTGVDGPSSTGGSSSASDGSTSVASSQAASSGSTTQGAAESSAGATSSSDSSSGSTAGSSSGSTSGGPDPVCTVYEFDDGQPFDPVSPPFPIEVDVIDGVLRADWLPMQLGGAAFVVEDPANVALGSLEFEIAGFPQETGTVLSATWEDESGHIISAFVDGGDFVVSHYDANLNSTTFPGGEPHGDRTRLRMRSTDGLVVIEAGGDGSFEPIASIDPGRSPTPFDPTEVEVSLFFNRYVAGGAATSIGLESVTTCESL